MRSLLHLQTLVLSLVTTSVVWGTNLDSLLEDTGIPADRTAPSPASVVPQAQQIDEAQARREIAKALTPPAPTKRTESLPTLARQLQSSPNDASALNTYLGAARRANRLGEALSLLETLSAAHPKNARLATAGAALAMELGLGDKARPLTARALELEPGNSSLWKQQGGISMAGRDFRTAEQAYSRALAADPQDAQLRRQLFRLYGILGDPAKADAVIAPVFHPGVDTLLSEELKSRPSLHQAQALKPWLTTAAVADQPPYASTESLELAVQTGSIDLSPAVRREILQVLAKIRPTYQLQRNAWTEYSASRASRAGHNIDASRLYRRLVAAEPQNISALYGLAGSLKGDGDIENAKAVYAQLVEMNPSDPVAAGALRKATDLLRDTIRVAMSFENEDSPGRLANITRGQMGIYYKTRITDKLSLEIGPRFWADAPKDGPVYMAEGMWAEALYRFNSFATIGLSFGLKAYNDPAAPITFTGGAKLLLNAWDRALISIGYSRDDVVHNEASILQGIQTDTVKLGVSSRFTDRVEASAEGRLLSYSDNNTQGIGSAQVAYTILKVPGTLKAGLGGTAIFTREQSRDIYANGALVDVEHPYWTPDQYGQGFAFVSWDQDLAPDAFAGANELSYGARVLTSYDTTSNLLIGADLHLRWEIIRNLILEAAGSIQRSENWNGASATLGTTYRF